MSFLTSMCPAGCQLLRSMGMPRCKLLELLTLFMPPLHSSMSTMAIPRSPLRTYVALSVPEHAQSMRKDLQSIFGASLNPTMNPPLARSRCLSTLLTHIASLIQKAHLEDLSRTTFWRRFRSLPAYQVLQQWMKLPFPLSYVCAEKTWTILNGNS